jgi:hypothetical protein
MVTLVVIAAMLAGCAGARLGDVGSDGAGDRPLADLLLEPDADPRVELIRNGGANRPYHTKLRSID